MFEIVMNYKYYIILIIDISIISINHKKINDLQGCFVI